MIEHTSPAFECVATREMCLQHAALHPSRINPISRAPCRSNHRIEPGAISNFGPIAAAPCDVCVEWRTLSSNTLRWPRLEVFTGAGRRRAWTAEQKARVVAESYAGGESVSTVARRQGLTPRQLFGWRRHPALREFYTITLF
jgi:hypothetical protein